jgi:hypothetical protein
MVVVVCADVVCRCLRCARCGVCCFDVHRVLFVSPFRLCVPHLDDLFTLKDPIRQVAFFSIVSRRFFFLRVKSNFNCADQGITSKGDRKKIMSAIEKIKQEMPQHAAAGLWTHGAPSGVALGGGVGSGMSLKGLSLSLSLSLHMMGCVPMKDPIRPRTLFFPFLKIRLPNTL